MKNLILASAMVCLAGVALAQKLEVGGNFGIAKPLMLMRKADSFIILRKGLTMCVVDSRWVLAGALHIFRLRK